MRVDHIGASTPIVVPFKTWISCKQPYLTDIFLLFLGLPGGMVRWTAASKAAVLQNAHFDEFKLPDTVGLL